LIQMPDDRRQMSETSLATGNWQLKADIHNPAACSGKNPTPTSRTNQSLSKTKPMPMSERL